MAMRGMLEVKRDLGAWPQESPETSPACRCKVNKGSAGPQCQVCFLNFLSIDAWWVFFFNLFSIFLLFRCMKFLLAFPVRWVLTVTT